MSEITVTHDTDPKLFFPYIVSVNGHCETVCYTKWGAMRVVKRLRRRGTKPPPTRTEIHRETV